MDATASIKLYRGPHDTSWLESSQLVPFETAKSKAQAQETLIEFMACFLFVVIMMMVISCVAFVSGVEVHI